MEKNHFEYKYKSVPFPKVRRAVTDFLHEAHHKHTIHLIAELDITEVRKYIHKHETITGETLSLTAFLIHCLAKAVDDDKYMHAYRKGGNLILFEEVDVATPIEREALGHRMGVVHIIRAANRKSFIDIHREIREAQEEKVDNRKRSKQFAWLSLPAFVRRFVWRRILAQPIKWKKFGGTVGVTAVGMFGKGGGWGIPMPNHTLFMTVGGIAHKPGVVEGRIEIREYLSITLSVDHDIIDGAPLARFAVRLKELVESSYGIMEGVGGN